MRRTRRSLGNANIDIGIFSDILTNVLGVLFFLTLLIALEIAHQQKVTIVAKSEKGENSQKNPRYIECRADGIVLYPSQEFIPKTKLKAPNSGLEKLIKEVKKSGDREYIIVVVRPNGIDLFNQVRDLVENQKISIGYEPIDSSWKLNIDGSITNEQKNASQIK
jgi:hypothetical protein